MALHFVTGNLLDDKSSALVNTVNYVGVMGKGIALQFKRRFPKYFQYYKALCNEGMIRTGRIDLYSDTESGKTLVSFPTKNHWSNPSVLAWIDSGLISLATAITTLKIKSIAIPMLGCSNGQLNWTDVRELIVKHLEDIPDCDIYVYGPML